MKRISRPAKGPTIKRHVRYGAIPTKSGTRLPALDRMRDIEIRLKELKEDCSMVSSMLAFGFVTFRCIIHERCDGGCGNFQGYVENPVIDVEGLLMSLLWPGSEAFTTQATSGHTPHDRHWFMQENLSSLLYFPIDSSGGEIRLLRVKEALFRADVVECELITAYLGRCEDFIALSYCWGSSETPEVMLCNGKSHRITTSLNAALKGFRESPQTRGRLLWADAVSIDQNNISEKSEQIPLMRRIYTEADACLVFLAEAEQLVTQGIDLMFRLSTIQSFQEKCEENRNIPLDEILSLLPSFNHNCWSEYLKIFRSPWFGRTWTLQEIALSKKAFIGVGLYVVDWYCMEKSLLFLEQHNLKTLLVSISGHGPELMNFLNIIHIQRIREISKSPDPSSALTAVLRATGHFKVTDPRDKVLGVLGLIGEIPEELRSMVDYSLGTAEVYHRAALYMLKNPSPPHVLAHAGLQRQSGRTSMPSWVPDWSFDDLNRNERPLLLFRPENFNAGGTYSAFSTNTDTDPFSRELCIPGFCNHRIVAAGQSYGSLQAEMNRTDSFGVAVCLAWLESARTCLESRGSMVYDDIEDAVARTLIVNDLYDHRNATRHTTAIENPKKAFRAAIARMRITAPDTLLREIVHPQIKDPVQTYIMQMKAVMRDRRFAITDTGYICLVPGCAELGDSVAILLGHPTPFTIRVDPVSQRSGSEVEVLRAILIGDTYMHGVMEGEFLTEVAKMGHKPCIIELL
ncbi:MAG: hypothetical protein L6R36_008706 [Xanthoria steineri]|nr:MAG: hypothetical protein L6R36_008706 [Xanthoria steineri]